MAKKSGNKIHSNNFNILRDFIVDYTHLCKYVPLYIAIKFNILR